MALRFNRRAFLRASPIVAGVIAAPVVAAVAYAATLRERVPMRGSAPNGQKWSMIELNTFGSIAPTCFVSRSMVRNGDGTYTMVYDRETPHLPVVVVPVLAPLWDIEV